MRGATLLEVVVGLAVLGSVLGLGAIRTGSVRDRILVERAASEIVTAYGRARDVALRSGGQALLTLRPDSILVWEFRRGDSAAVWQSAGPAGSNVQVAGTVARVVFAPNGLTMGLANGTIVLSRGGVRRALIMSRLGRIRVDRSP